MNKTEEKCFFETIRELKEINPGLDSFRDIPPLIRALHRYQVTLHRLAELECNGYPRPVTEFRDGKYYRYDVEDVKLRERCEKKEARIRDAASNIAKKLNVGIEFGGDPRGAVMRLIFPNGRKNGWGDGWILDW